MKIDRELKQEINKEWQSAFPQLGSYTQNKFFKVLGTLIVGIELIKVPFMEQYRPHFVIYTLFDKDLGTNLSEEILLQEFYNKKGFQCDIPYLKHNEYFKEVVSCIDKQLPISLEVDIQIDKINVLLESYIRKAPFNGGATNSFSYAKYQEIKMKIALYLNKERAQQVFRDIYNVKWDNKSFEESNGSINSWLVSLQEVIDNRDTFLRQIEINKQSKKILKLPYSEIVL
ncbi:hypothetical protein [Capnocytophaga sputigena]|jgi:hypothetical protein|uniref:hypothetical protein n=1 Tax=Capnocytophaga sputigena TaxID=1019 RepID=UPI000BB168B9|nr:hypothetical protein [Capnocytophaga sputigena]ATA71367.1 hypothetical protein CGC57_10835 [Capnocytophaga sputigena]VEI56145.1 Uncharacterised protein [Capnocytophaga sputigena]